MDREKDSSCIIGEYYTSNAIQEYIAKHYWQLAYFQSKYLYGCYCKSVYQSICTGLV